VKIPTLAHEGRSVSRLVANYWQQVLFAVKNFTTLAVGCASEKGCRTSRVCNSPAKVDRLAWSVPATGSAFGFGRRVGFRLTAAMGPVRLAVDLQDDRAIDHAIQKVHRQRGIAEVIAPGVEVDVGDQGGGRLPASMILYKRLAACGDSVRSISFGLRACPFRFRSSTSGLGNTEVTGGVTGSSGRSSKRVGPSICSLLRLNVRPNNSTGLL
jgi:hypothetical protein